MELRKGALIGLVGGLLTGPIMLLWLVVYSAVRPDRHLGSTAIMGPFMGGILETLLGVALGALGGAVVGAVGIRLVGLRSCIRFGAVLMGLIAIVGVWQDAFGNPERFRDCTGMVIGMEVACPILAGIVAGVLIGRRAENRLRSASGR